MTASAPTLEEPFSDTVATPEEAHTVGPEFVAAVGKVIASHVRNELAGAAVFDEPAIALAPGPQEKWLACRIAMEEYGHHLKFNKLALELGLDDPMGGRTLSVFDYDLRTWTEFVVLKAVVDLAEVVLMEELAVCTYLPLRHLAAKLLPEERFHVSFGRARSQDLARSPERRPEIQQAVDDLVRFTLPFFGRSDSANNELFRRWGVKRTTNDQARAAFIERSRAIVVDDLGLRYPEVSVTWDG
ncbi:MAG TPA: Phenylacetic acid catabolic protein [Acidimicrobiales bacterium]|nr:Phenylacetic acid catabolic protein [Acidimicrobiales bacterium]